MIVFEFDEDGNTTYNGHELKKNHKEWFDRIFDLDSMIRQLEQEKNELEIILHKGLKNKKNYPPQDIDF